MISSQWKEVNLGDIAVVTKLAGYEFTKYINYTEKGEIIAIRALNVKNNTLDLSDIKRIDRDTSNNLTRSKLNKNDIVLTYTGAKFGEVAIINYNNKYHLAPNVAKVTSNNEDECDSYYLFSYLTSDEFKTKLRNYSVGSSQPTIPMSTIRQLSIPLPPIEIQKEIANTLSVLDEKIELNNKISKNLEEVSQALFKSWFIDFEPYQDGEFDESELGMIPKGWVVRSLDEIADFINGLAMQKYRPETDDEYLPVIKIKELNQGFTNSDSDKSRIDIPDRNKINNGDIIFSWSGTLMVKVWAGGNGGLNQHLFKVVSDKFPKWFYYLWTKYHLQNFIAIANDRATTMGHIKRSHLSEAKVVIPNEEELRKLNDIIDPILTQSIEANIQSNKLIEIRDALLPKLMSGEIRIPIEEV